MGRNIGKEEVKLSLFEDTMILYVENSRNQNQKTPRIIELSKVTVYSVSV
jgi:hypothetical protein